ncbi:hypothetical protein FisN_15Lh045 [Fistulifera solaris]|uniref:MYND-type domain-containing protein n=1 Tax=Fistulifera solaris TaxID=1519565 RepID=A0A1Z5KHG5_FISSO|nr:hypothetical protein FisN_15Lh045 [Fistulifera solaris]|eukprot:GAX25676.1 hypothetical protein FisN_15Lh045 [Fistulifera solaris]
MDGWEDLFAKASGSQDVAPQNTTAQKAEKKSSRKRRHERSVSTFDAYLESRWEITTNWPMSSHCFELKQSFDTKCSAFQASDGFHCRRCTLPAYEHALLLSSQGRQMWWMAILCDIWNVRNASKSAALRLVNKAEIDWTKSDAILRESQQALQAIATQYKEGGSYLEKLLLQLEQFLLQKRSEKTAYDTFVGAVKQIMMCDDVYYQLYYQQLTKDIPFDEHYVLPHPTEYFAACCTDNQMLRQVEEEGEQTSDLQIIGWDALFRDDMSAFHPLLALHWYRRTEGESLFRATLSKGQHNPKIMLWKKPLVLSSRHPTSDATDYQRKLVHHGTLAPILLQQWRDSCRDFLCHLYAYATLNVSSLPKIQSFLQDTNCTGITEVGAGTGYIAGWLKKNGIEVSAFDLIPTGGRDMNEYHGNTPSFERVDYIGQEGQPTIESARSQALLLCYPPPNAVMAHGVLQTFIMRGGRSMIYTGEWKGLTGSSNFEKFLLKHMKCVGRHACSTWGTDAACISFWTLRNSKEKRSLLIPCRYCAEKEATRRCRLLRSLNYCSAECFKSHQLSREFLMKLLMIDPNAVEIDFDDDAIFQSLN